MAQTKVRVLLIRHGPSALVPPNVAIDRAALEQWYRGYDELGIADGAVPPPNVVAEVARADLLAVSDMPRAIASAKRLAPDRSMSVVPLFREESLPIPSFRRLRARLGLWETLIHLRWLFAMAVAQDATPDARERARRAAAWCRDACQSKDADPSTIAIVTHGVFRRLLARELLRDGWRWERGRRSYSHWSVWRLHLPSA